MTSHPFRKFILIIALQKINIQIKLFLLILVNNLCHRCHKLFIIFQKAKKKYFFFASVLKTFMHFSKYGKRVCDAGCINIICQSEKRKKMHIGIIAGMQ
jgi:hypothetical protein